MIFSDFRTLSRPLLLLLLLPLGSCGNDQKGASYNITLNGHAVVWAGYADADPRLKGSVDATVSCLRANGLATRPGYPMVQVVDGIFNCDTVLARGCTEIGGSSIYITRDYLYTGVFTHEVVHWETGMGNEYHTAPQFTLCCSGQDG